MANIIGVKACIADGTDFFLVGEDGYSCICRMQCIQLCTECRISTYTIIVSGGCDQASVKTNITGRACGNNFKFGTIEICFNNTVFLIQNLKDF